MRGRIMHIYEEQMIAFIWDEDCHAKEKTTSYRSYAAITHPIGIMRMAKTSQYYRSDADKRDIALHTVQQAKSHYCKVLE